VVDRPFVLARGASVREARELARRHNVTGLLIEEAPGSGILAGLLSNRDWPWSPAQDDRPVGEFMTPYDRLVTGPPEISIEEAERRVELLTERGEVTPAPASLGVDPGEVDRSR